MKRRALIAALIGALAGCIEREPLAPPQGLYFAFTFGGANAMQFGAWYFAPDGSVLFDGDRGAVKMVHDRMAIVWPDGNTTEDAIERVRDQFRWNGMLFTRVEPFANARAIAGTWESGSLILNLHEDGSLDHGGRWKLEGHMLTVTDVSGVYDHGIALPVDANTMLFGKQVFRRRR